MSNQHQQNKTENMPYGLLISATYNIQKQAAILKFYEPVSQRIFLWADKSGHRPYCYSKLSPDEIPTEIFERDDVIEIKQVKLLDILHDKPIDVSKILVQDPLAIGGTQTSKALET